MTTKEFSSEFDILYDNASKGAPGLDLYEKSVFLTQAQEEIVKEAYSGYSQTRVSFEGSERRRRQLSELVKDFRTVTEAPGEQTSDRNSTGNSSNSSLSLIAGSKFYYLPAELMYIILERVTIAGGNIINVTPVTHDEFNQSIKNPFKKPNVNRAWRLDLYAPGAYQKVELVADGEIVEYHIRYVKKPDAIILTNFESDDELTGLNLTVDGDNVEKTSELNDEIHRDVLARAVEIAVRITRENTLANKVKLNRNIV